MLSFSSSSSSTYCRSRSFCLWVIDIRYGKDIEDVPLKLDAVETQATEQVILGTTNQVINLFRYISQCHTLFRTVQFQELAIFASALWYCLMMVRLAEHIWVVIVIRLNVWLSVSPSTSNIRPVLFVVCQGLDECTGTAVGRDKQCKHRIVLFVFGISSLLFGYGSQFCIDRWCEFTA